jgi:hypothetical protein
MSAFLGRNKYRRSAIRAGTWREHPTSALRSLSATEVKRGTWPTRHERSITPGARSLVFFRLLHDRGRISINI